jgi:heptosyltransferase-1
MASPRSLLVVRLSAMGDIIHSLPAANLLKEAFPGATLGWVVEERWAELLCAPSVPRCGSRSPQKPIADKIHTVNTRAWRQSLLSDATWRDIGASLREIRAERYEVAVDVQGAVRSALIARLSGAPVIYGFAQPRENAASLFYSRQVQARGTHIVEQNLSLALAVAQCGGNESSCEPAGMGVSTPHLLPRDDAAERECYNRLERLGIHEYAVLNPGAGWGAKQWPPQRYGVVAKRLSEELGLRSLINVGPDEEFLARELEEASEGAAAAFSGSISELIALTRGARIFIGGDTGPLHLAAALGIPVVGIFGPTDPARNGPYGTPSIVLRSPESVTSHKRRQTADEGMLSIRADNVMNSVVRLLKGHRG